MVGGAHVAIPALIDSCGRRSWHMSANRPENRAERAFRRVSSSALEPVVQALSVGCGPSLK